MAPLANTFSPSMKGQAKGLLTTTAQIKGAGITGAGLKRSLNSQVNILLTNAEIHVVSGTQRVWFLPLDLNLIATLLNMPEITRSPITFVDVKTVASGGKLDLQRALVRGDAFQAQAGGGIRFADVLDDSLLQVPVEISLSRALAQRANLLSSDTPVDAAYA